MWFSNSIGSNRRKGRRVAGLIDDGENWLAMLVDRNRTSHTYNEATAEAILLNIREKHFPLFERLKAVMADKS